jgi:hypothetical protein
VGILQRASFAVNPDPPGSRNVAHQRNALSIRLESAGVPIRRVVEISAGLVVACATILNLLPVDGAGAADAVTSGKSAAHVMAPAAIPVGALKNSATPNTNIVKNGGSTTYDPSEVSTSFYGSTPKKCTQKRLGVTFTNETNKTREVTYKGAVFESLPPGSVGGACFVGSKDRTYVFGLAKSESELTVSVS